MSRKRWEDTLPEARERLAADPENVDLLVGLAESLFEWYKGECIHRDLKGKDVGDAERWVREAYGYLDRAEKLAPQDPRPPRLRGFIHHFHKEADLALGEFQRALDIDPRQQWVRHQVATIYYDQGEYDAAERELQMELEFDPEYKHALLTLGHVYRKTGRFEQAFSTYTRLIEVEPGNRTAKACLGLAHGHLGNFEIGEACLWDSLDGEEEWVGGHYALSEFYALAGRTEEAESMRKRAEQLYRQVETF